MGVLRDRRAVPANLLRRRILVVASCGVFMLALLSAAAALTPMALRLWSATEQKTVDVARIHASAVGEYVLRVGQVALQIASRSRARDLLEVLGRTPEAPPVLLQELRDALSEAMSIADEIEGITRLSERGKALASVGRAVPPELRSLCTSRAVCVDGPARIGDAYFLVVSAPIRGVDGKRLGTDIILYSVDKLDALLQDRTGMGRGGRAWLQLRGPEPLLYGQMGADPAISGLLPRSARAYAVLQELAELRQESFNTELDEPEVVSVPPYLVTRAPVVGSDWIYVARMDEAEVFAGIRQQILYSALIAVLLTALGSGALFVLLRPLAGGLVVKTETLAEEVRARTSELHLANLRLKGFVEELRHAKQELEVLATTDSLTGVANRRHITEEAERLMARLRRHHHQVSVLVFDLDRFKTINDTHGHVAGDRVLEAFARSAAEQLRTEDIFGRLGGEEFLAVLPETDQAEGMAVAERIRESVARLRFEAPEGSFGVTVSIGLASVRADSTSFTSLLRRADAALYRAKSDGRNRVVAAEEGLAPRFPDSDRRNT